jgi:mannose-6-phosphate isomerase-like protein (cupin superfamily)
MHLERKRFESPDEVRQFPKGRFELVRVGGMVIGRATYNPGWKWSEHVGVATGQKSCQVSHVGMVVAGQMKVKMDDGRELTLNPGDVFAIGPGHDSWVVGDASYISLHFEGAEQYAKK